MTKVQMLGDKDASPNIAVKNLEVAKKFYEDILGLTYAGEEEELLLLKSGNTVITVYQSQNAGPTKPQL
jgi:catechol-2,3-dioxygenase